MVLLGFLDEPKSTKNNGVDDDPKNWTISRIGGEPAFPNERVAKELQAKLICSKCSNKKTFVCQLYCPLDGHPYDRAVYLFACRNPSCWNSSSSWTAVRCQKYDESVDVNDDDDDDDDDDEEDDDEESPAKVPTTTADWCDEANAWGSDEEEQVQPTIKMKKTKKPKSEIEPTALIKTMKIEENESSADEDEDDDDDEDENMNVDQAASKKTKPIPVASADAFNEWKKQNLQATNIDVTTEKYFPFYYIDIDDEKSVIDEAKLYEKKKTKNQVSKFESIDEDEDQNGSKTKENYEKSNEIEHGDVVFYRFQQKIRYAPEQIIRYDWSGEPLIIKKLSNQGLSSVSKCPHCQSSSHFEFQLMPALVNFLKIDKQIALEFGTVFVFTCSKNCWNRDEDLFRIENVFVQEDPDQNLFD